MPDSQRPKLVKTYQYTDENGNALYEKQRYEPGPDGKKKGFKQRRFDEETGEWIWGVNKDLKVLYNLPSVVKNPEVFIAFGEKDADTLCSLGLCGTTNSDGEGQKWSDESGNIAEFAKPLAGKDVIVFPDQDEAGKRCIEHVLPILQSIAKSVSVVNVAPSKDVTDYLVKDGHSPQELNRLIEVARLPENAPVKRLQKLVRQRGEPSAIESEKVILGALLKGIVRTDDLDLINEEDFFFRPNRILWSSIAESSEKGACDRAAVAQILEDYGKLEEVGGLTYLIDLTEDLPTQFNIEYHVERVKAKSSGRKLSASLVQAAERIVGGEDPEKIRAEIEVSIKDAPTSNDSQTHSVVEIVGDIEEFLKPVTNGIMCKPLGPVMQSTYGLRPGQLVVIAGRPGSGKSSYASILCAYSAAALHETELLSFEVPEKEALLKMACMLAKVPMISVISGTINDRQRSRLYDKIKQLKKLPLRIDDRNNWTIQKLRNHLKRRVAAGKPLRLLCIDYLQLMSIPGSTHKRRDLEIGEITRGLKQLAIEFGLTILLLSQLNREGEKQGRLPSLIDLRESGSIEQDADMVSLIWQDYSRDSSDDMERDAKIIIPKQRNGGIYEHDVVFSKPFTYFYSKYADVEPPDYDKLLS
jgi:replicative DNA helicase